MRCGGFVWVLGGCWAWFGWSFGGVKQPAGDYKSISQVTEHLSTKKPEKKFGLTPGRSEQTRV